MKSDTKIALIGTVIILVDLALIVYLLYLLVKE